MTKRRLFLLAGLIALPLLLTGIAFLYRAHVTQRDLEKWQTYQESARTRGEDLGVEAWLPPQPADAENFFTHPWILGFLTGESSPQAEAAASMQPWPGLGLDGYELRVGDEEAGEPVKSWFEDKPEDRDRVLETVRTHAADLAAIREAAARSHSRAQLDLSQGYQGGLDAWCNLSDLGTLLGVHADAALAAGDEATAVADLEALLRLGAHFRGQHFLLSLVIGAGIEARALAVIEAGATKKAFSPASKQRLRAARRSGKVEEEIASTLRVERGMYLKTVAQFVTKAGRQNQDVLPYKPERLVATNSLFFCEMLDSALLPAPSVAGWRDFDQRIATLRAPAKSGNLTAIATATLLATGGVASGMVVQEEEFDRVYKLLDP